MLLSATTSLKDKVTGEKLTQKYLTPKGPTQKDPTPKELTQKELTQKSLASKLAAFAVDSLLEEVRLTPKPGLVDSHNNGSHHDLTLRLMESSALSLEETFFEMAMASFEKRPTRHLRERLAAIGRHGEQQMLAATGQVNTHKGAIWVLGLLTGAAAIHLTPTSRVAASIPDLLTTAGAIASFEDRYKPPTATNGDQVRRSFHIRSAREEAAAGFPSLQQTALPAWTTFANEPEPIRRLNVLLALMSVVDDTCILHRSNMKVLKQVRQQAAAIISKGGMGIGSNAGSYRKLDRFVTDQWVSPGGSADLLAATIFLNKIIKIN